MDAAAWQTLGTHQVRVHEDLLFIQVRGVLTLSDLQGLMRLGAVQIERYGYHLSIVDATLATTMTAEARRYDTQWRRENPQAVGCSVVYGANWIARAVITMIARATALLTRRAAESHCVADEAAALEWAGAERQRLRAELAQRQPPPTS